MCPCKLCSVCNCYRREKQEGDGMAQYIIDQGPDDDVESGLEPDYDEDGSPF